MAFAYVPATFIASGCFRNEPFNDAVFQWLVCFDGQHDRASIERFQIAVAARLNDRAAANVFGQFVLNSHVDDARRFGDVDTDVVAHDLTGSEMKFERPLDLARSEIRRAIGADLDRHRTPFRRIFIAHYNRHVRVQKTALMRVNGDVASGQVRRLVERIDDNLCSGDFLRDVAQIVPGGGHAPKARREFPLGLYAMKHRRSKHRKCQGGERDLAIRVERRSTTVRKSSARVDSCACRISAWTESPNRSAVFGSIARSSYVSSALTILVLNSGRLDSTSSAARVGRVALQ